jgi:8-oxo-dGTP diphosphatase
VSTPPTLQVVAAILRDRDQRVLIAQRPPGKPMAGFWEFPGGKLAAGESEQSALVRELREELGIEVRASRWLTAVTHDYGDRVVELAVWIVERFDGLPQGIEGQALKWVAVSQLSEQGLLPADQPIVEILNRG